MNNLMKYARGPEIYRLVKMLTDAEANAIAAELDHVVPENRSAVLAIAIASSVIEKRHEMNEIRT